MESQRESTPPEADPLLSSRQCKLYDVWIFRVLVMQSLSRPCLYSDHGTVYTLGSVKDLQSKGTIQLN